MTNFIWQVHQLPAALDIIASSICNQSKHCNSCSVYETSQHEQPYVTHYIYVACCTVLWLCFAFCAAIQKLGSGGITIKCKRSIAQYLHIDMYNLKITAQVPSKTVKIPVAMDGK